MAVAADTGEGVVRGLLVGVGVNTMITGPRVGASVAVGVAADVGMGVLADVAAFGTRGVLVSADNAVGVAGATVADLEPIQQPVAVVRQGSPRTGKIRSS